jgi:protein-disulfide isomerase
MDRAIRAEVKRDRGIRYAFRPYPLEAACNHELPAGVRPEAMHPGACRAARVAEAAGSLGGDAAFWSVHTWLMEHAGTTDDAAIGHAARVAGLEPAALLAVMDTPAVRASMDDDARAARLLGLTALPMVFVNGKWVPRTMHGDENVVLQVLKSLSR